MLTVRDTINPSAKYMDQTSGTKVLPLPSYVLLMAGLAFVFFAVWYWLFDVSGKVWDWLKLSEICGMNLISAYMLSRLDEFRQSARFWKIDM